MTSIVHDPSHAFATRDAAAARQAARHAAHAHHLMRDALRRELEAELRGLLMAARVHGFRLAIEAGKPVVTELP